MDEMSDKHGNITGIDLALQHGVVTSKGVDAFFLYVCGCLIFFMQAGFALLEVGSVRVKNVNTILLNNVMDICVGALAYYSCGFAISFGYPGEEPSRNTTGINRFLGTSSFFLWDIPKDNNLAAPDGQTSTFVFFQYTFAATATAIVSGAMVGRTRYQAYIIYAFVITGFVYPVVVHWTWSPDGWLNKGIRSSDGTYVSYEDFAGSGVIHVLGGTAAFMGAAILGKRHFAVQSVDYTNIPPYSPALAALGSFILMFGFFAFNGSSQGEITSPNASETVAKAVINTAISASAGGITVLIIERVYMKNHNDYWVLLSVANGVLGGMVSICASCDVIKHYIALVCGVFGTSSMLIWSHCVRKMGLEDPVDAVALHLGCGSWGVLTRPLFHPLSGVLYSWDITALKILGWHVAGLLSIIAWTAITTGALFKSMDCCHWLRSALEIQEMEFDTKSRLKRLALGTSKDEMLADAEKIRIHIINEDLESVTNTSYTLSTASRDHYTSEGLTSDVESDNSQNYSVSQKSSASEKSPVSYTDHSIKSESTFADERTEWVQPLTDDDEESDI